MKKRLVGGSPFLGELVFLESWTSHYFGSSSRYALVVTSDGRLYLAFFFPWLPGPQGWGVSFLDDSKGADLVLPLWGGTNG